MELHATDLAGVYVIDVTKHEDDRGFFARTWDPAIAKEQGLRESFDYTCISLNQSTYTLRGMHYQHGPHGETKLVRCTKGAIFDVALDLRPDSPTFKQWFGVELSAENHRALYIPHGFAHGFLTLEPDSEMLYHIGGALAPETAAGVRWDDPAFGMTWPASPHVISKRDGTYPDYRS